MNLSRALLQPTGPDRTAATAAWFQGLFERDPPVLVGGAAVELYTGGAYRTADLDFVGRVPPKVTGVLARNGFARRGRHWIHEQAQVFLEFPSTSFDRDVQIVALRIEDWTVILLSPEDILVDRLAAWKFWSDPVDGINAFLLYRAQKDSLDTARLEAAARIEDVRDALDSLASFGDRDRNEEEVEEWARNLE